MARPKPTILMSDARTAKTEEVLRADAIYAVFLDDRPINLRLMKADVWPKYKRVSFSNIGHAFNLADKLNTMFDTDRFTVYKLTQGEKM